MNWRKYIVDNSWTWGGTSLVLLTLTGSTLYWAVCITVVVVFIHAILTLGLPDE
jgi:Mn2+/Fe2+ NRAMP family transporter